MGGVVLTDGRIVLQDDYVTWLEAQAEVAVDLAEALKVVTRALVDQQGPVRSRRTEDARAVARRALAAYREAHGETAA